eukprot:jgi/Tetstr1/429939/TSEL_019802.t1
MPSHKGKRDVTSGTVKLSLPKVDAIEAIRLQTDPITAPANKLYTNAGTAWAFAEKHDKDGNFIKRKAIVVVRGDQLTAGENYDDTKTYAPVISFIALRTTIALAV